MPALKPAPKARTRSAATPPVLHVSKSAQRSLTLLDTVVTQGLVSLGDAAAATDMALSTALRHLRALVQSGYLIRDNLGQFSVGPSFIRLAMAAFRSGPYARLIAAAQPHLERMVAATEESAYLAVRDADSAIYIATVESPRAIRHVGWVGSSVPLVGTAIGEALSAPVLARGQPPNPVFNTGAIESDVTAVTTAIHGSSGVIGAFSILGPTDRMADDRLALATEVIVQAATDVALQLSAPVLQP